LLTNLSAGLYTAVISGVNGAAGEALAETYDTANGTNPYLSSISTRGLVTSSTALIAGFVVTGTANKQVLVRGVGPALSNYGVPNALSTPSLTLYWPDAQGNQHAIYTNVGWGNAWNASDIPSATASVGDFALPQGSADCVLLVSLPPGTYTAVVSGVNGATGNALVEVYDVR